MTNIRGENNPNYGKFGEEHPSYKEDAGYVAKHEWINKHYPQKNVCNDKCEICGKINLNLDLAQFRHINVRNMDDPIIDYLYMCPYNEKDGCHRIYDDNLSDEQKKELLKGATTREEKLNGIRKYILKQKEEIKNV